MRLNNDETLARIEVILALSSKELGQLRLFSYPATPTPLVFLRSLDQLTRPGEHLRRDCHPDLLRGLEINHKLKLRGLLGQAGRQASLPSGSLST